MKCYHPFIGDASKFGGKTAKNPPFFQIAFIPPRSVFRHAVGFLRRKFKAAKKMRFFRWCRMQRSSLSSLDWRPEIWRAASSVAVSLEFTLQRAEEKVLDERQDARRNFRRMLDRVFREGRERTR